MTLSSHQRSTTPQTGEWLTPPEILQCLGEFDLDPCAPIVRPWPTAKKHYTIEDDGLNQKWEGRVWLNPPFGVFAGTWLNRLANHGNGIALVAARTETKWFFRNIWDRADSILFLEGRPHFYRVDGTRGKTNSGAPICLVAYGMENSAILSKSHLLGIFVPHWI